MGSEMCIRDRLGAVLVNYAKTYLTGAMPEFWLFALGGLFVAVTLFFPKGIVGEMARLRELIMRKRKPPKMAAAEAGDD